MILGVIKRCLKRRRDRIGLAEWQTRCKIEDEVRDRQMMAMRNAMLCDNGWNPTFFLKRCNAQVKVSSNWREGEGEPQSLYVKVEVAAPGFEPAHRDAPYMVSAWQHASIGYRLVQLGTDGKPMTFTDDVWEAMEASLQATLQTSWDGFSDEISVWWRWYTRASAHVSPHEDCEFYAALLELRAIVLSLGWVDSDEDRIWEWQLGRFHVSQVHMYPRSHELPDALYERSPRSLQSS